MLICDGPSSPIEMPLCVPTTFTFTFGIGHGYAQLLETFVNGETREAGGERNLPAGREAGRDADHIGLGDSTLDESLRKFLREQAVKVDFERSASQRHDIPVLAAQLHQSLAEGLACSHADLQFKFGFGFHLRQLLKASFISCWVGATP